MSTGQESFEPQFGLQSALRLASAVKEVIGGSVDYAKTNEALYGFGTLIDWYGRDFKSNAWDRSTPDLRLKVSFRVAVKETFGDGQIAETVQKYLRGELGRLANQKRPDDRFIAFLDELIEMLTEYSAKKDTAPSAKVSVG